MSVDLPTLAARARGLGTHLLRRSELEQLAALELRSLAGALAQSGRLEPIAEPPTASGIEAAARRTAARQLRVLSTWAGSDPVLDVFYADQDRRIVRSMLRGAIEGAPTELRASGLLPTPLLPERAIVELAREPTPARVAAHLVLLRHPEANRLLAIASRAQPGLFDLELALSHGFAARVRASARAGDRNLRGLVAARLDALNAQSALAIVASPREIEPAVCFLDGGAELSRQAFVLACDAGSKLAATELLTRALGGSPLGPAVAAAAGDPARLERGVLASLLEWQRARARLEPLSSAPLLVFLLRLEAQSVDLRRLAWGAALQAPGSTLRAQLVTPWS
jgi:hypothetical protein